MKKWEYKVYDGYGVGIETLGIQGWELVGVTRVRIEYEGSRHDTDQTKLYFKREIVDGQ